MEKDTAKLWVKVIAILGFIGAALGIIGGLAMLFGGTFTAALIPFLGGALVGAVLIATAIIVFIVSVFEFIVALNLWRYKNWARIVLIVFSILGAIGALMSLPMGILTLIIYGGVLYLLAFNKDVVNLFKKKR